MIGTYVFANERILNKSVTLKKSKFLYNGDESYQKDYLSIFREDDLENFVSEHNNTNSAMMFHVHKPLRLFETAVSNGAIKIVRWMHENISGLKEQVKNDRYTSPMSDAAINCQFEMVKWLYDNGYSDFHEKSLCMENENAFSQAAYGGSIEILDWMYRTDPTIIDTDGGSLALFMACEANEIKAAKWLYKKKPEHLYQRDFFGCSILQCALMFSGRKIIRWLLSVAPQLKETLDEDEMKELNKKMTRYCLFHFLQPEGIGFSSGIFLLTYTP